MKRRFYALVHDGNSFDFIGPYDSFDDADEAGEDACVATYDVNLWICTHADLVNIKAAAAAALAR